MEWRSIGDMHLCTMHGLFYPFHLCHERTLHRLLEHYHTIHFRDFMALQLTPLTGITAFPDRMGDYYPELVTTGRIRQGYQVNGPLSQRMIASVDRDLSDPSWRSTFHRALTSNHRFQGSFFRAPSRLGKEDRQPPESPLPQTLTQSARETAPYSVKLLQAMSRWAQTDETAVAAEYGMALLTTSASLQYTLQLCGQHDLVAVTDSRTHYELLAQTCQREGLEFSNHWLPREGY